MRDLKDDFSLAVFRGGEIITGIHRRTGAVCVQHEAGPGMAPLRLEPGDSDDGDSFLFNGQTRRGLSKLRHPEGKFFSHQTGNLEVIIHDDVDEPEVIDIPGEENDDLDAL